MHGDVATLLHGYDSGDTRLYQQDSDTCIRPPGPTKSQRIDDYNAFMKALCIDRRLIMYSTHSPRPPRFGGYRYMASRPDRSHFDALEWTQISRTRES